MAEMFRMLLRGVLTLLSPFPMPWRATFVLLLALLAVSLFFMRVLPWVFIHGGRLLLVGAEAFAGLLLWPEYQRVRSLRQRGAGAGTGTYLLGDALNGLLAGVNRRFSGWSQTAGRLLKRRRLPHYAFFLTLAITVPSAWYARSLLRDTAAAAYLNSGFNWWNNLETYARAGTWPPQPPKPVPVRPHVYVVQKGDHLKKIADRFGVTVEEIVEANVQTYPSMATNRTKLNAGWRLIIPARD